jgi:hypothetical protein
LTRPQGKAQLHATANPAKGLGKERRVRAAAGWKVNLCRLKPAFRRRVGCFLLFFVRDGEFIQLSIKPAMSQLTIVAGKIGPRIRKL